jgi:hypothetical protein
MEQASGVVASMGAHGDSSTQGRYVLHFENISKHFNGARKLTALVLAARFCQEHLSARASESIKRRIQDSYSDANLLSLRQGNQANSAVRC